MSGIDILITKLCLSIACNNNQSTVFPFPLLTNSNQIFSTDNNTDSVNSVDVNNSFEFQSSLNASEHDLIKTLHREINGKILTVVSMEDYPLSYTEMRNGKIIGKGVTFQILEFLTEKFNFTYNLLVPPNNNFGSTNDMNGSLIEILNKSQADFAAAFVPILSDARQYIFYSKTTLDEAEYMMIMTRPAESATGSGLLAPFDTNVWILILVSLLSVGPIIYGLIIVRYKLTKETNQKLFPLPHCIWFVYGALLKQGSTLTVIADSTRLLFATWWIFITILTAFYTANLTAFLTLSKFTLPINTVDDLYKQNHLFVALKGGCVEYSIRNANESLTHLSSMLDAGRGVLLDDGSSAVNVLNTFVKEEGYVYIKDKPGLNYLLYNDYRYRKTISLTDEKIQCPFAVAKTPFLVRKRAFAYPRNTKWHTLFDPELLHLVESGIIKYMLSENLPNAEICPQNLGGTERQLRNNDLLMTYFITLTGFCIACVIFITEIMFKHLCERHGMIQENINQIITNKKNQSITPPPSYSSINNIHSLATWTIQQHNKSVNDKRSSSHNNQLHTGYKQYINGRYYMVYMDLNGTRRLIPIRQASATLFHDSSYTH